jgi:hypothetical protein
MLDQGTESGDDRKFSVLSIPFVPFVGFLLDGFITTIILRQVSYEVYVVIEKTHVIVVSAPSRFASIYSVIGHNGNS